MVDDCKTSEWGFWWKTRHGEKMSDGVNFACQPIKTVFLSLSRALSFKLYDESQHLVVWLLANFLCTTTTRQGYNVFCIHWQHHICFVRFNSFPPSWKCVVVSVLLKKKNKQKQTKNKNQFYQVFYRKSNQIRLHLLPSSNPFTCDSIVLSYITMQIFRLFFISFCFFFLIFSFG